MSGALPQTAETHTFGSIRPQQPSHPPAACQARCCTPTADAFHVVPRFLRRCQAGVHRRYCNCWFTFHADPSTTSVAHAQYAAD